MTAVWLEIRKGTRTVPEGACEASDWETGMMVQPFTSHCSWYPGRGIASMKISDGCDFLGRCPWAILASNSSASFNKSSACRKLSSSGLLHLGCMYKVKRFFSSQPIEQLSMASYLCSMRCVYKIFSMVSRC